MLVPLGAWCRTAYQVRQFSARHGLDAKAYPFDWTITSFHALRRVLEQNFDPECALRPESLVPSVTQSITDRATGLIHHHDFLPKMLVQIGNPSGKRVNGLAQEILDSDITKNSRQRFLKAWQNLAALRTNKGPLEFVRWQRFGHPDCNVRDAFADETPQAIVQSLTSFLGHDDFRYLEVTSVAVDQLSGSRIRNYIDGGQIVTATIAERPGFDGDGMQDFRGDTESWWAVLERFSLNC